MNLKLNPAVAGTLALDGRQVTLSAQELATLCACLPENGQNLPSALPRAVFKQLFQQQFLQLEATTAASSVRYWQERWPALALSPYLSLSLDFSDGAHRFGMLEPAIALFLRPDFVAWAENLAGEMRQAIMYVARGPLVWNLPVARERGLVWLQNILAQELARRPDFAQALRDEAGYAALRSPAPSFSLAQLFATTGRPNNTDSVPLPCEEWPAWARVLDSLRGPADVVAAQDLTARVRHGLEAIERAGGFIPRAEAPPIFPQQAGPDCALAVTAMAHAHLIVDGGGRRVLLDPWLHPWRGDFAQQPLTSYQLGPVDAICFTHHHPDHLELSSLLALPHDVPVFVPEDGVSPFTPRLAEFLRLLGFQDVRTLAHGARHVLDGGLTIESVPFYGETQDRLGFGANCYMFSRQGQNVLAHADASPDSQGRSVVSAGWVRETVARVGAIKAIFGTWWQERELVCRLSPLAIFTPGITPADWLTDTEMCDCPPEFVRDLAQEAKATHFFTYAESGAENFLRLDEMSMYVPGVSFYWQSWADYERRLREIGVKMRAAQPYMTVRLSPNGAVEVDWTRVETSRLPIADCGSRIAD